MSDYMKRLIEQAEEGLLDWDAGLQELAKDQKNAVESDTFDRMAWEMMKDSTPLLSEMEQKLVDDLGEVAREAMEDLFHLLHKGDPRFTERDAMDPEYEINLVMFIDLSETEEFKALAESTRYDEYATAFAMLSMEDMLRAAFEATKELRDQLKNARSQQESAMSDLAAAVDDAIDGAQQDPAGLEAAIQARQDALDALDAARAAGAPATQQATEQLRQGAMQAKNELDAEQTSVGGWGNEPGELQRMSFEERRALAQRVAGSRLKKFAEMLGNMKFTMASEAVRKLKHAPEEVYDYELGNDLTRLPASELLNLAVPELEEQFWLRWAQYELLNAQLRGTERAGQGPIIVVCDESQSMTSAVHGGHTREAWSKALSLALCDQAKRGHRDFIYVGFASWSQQWEMRFEGGKAPIEKVIDFTEHFFNGGTSYEEPLTRAMEIVEEYEKGGKDRPDIVFITDDECDVHDHFIESWRKLKERAAMTVYGITIGGARVGTMKQLADRTFAINTHNATPHGIKDLFREI
jgi:uncharacterized protein with von Willebrand factor type A (vWA) domain